MSKPFEILMSKYVKAEHSAGVQCIVHQNRNEKIPLNEFLVLRLIGLLI